VKDIYDMPGHLVRRFQQIAVAVFHAEVGEAGSDLTPVQYAALVALAKNPGVDQATLAGLIAYDRTTIGGVIDRLVQKGLVSREVKGRDRRARSLRITEDGLSTVTRIEPAVLTAQQIMLRGLSDEEVQTFMSLLRKAIADANDLSRAPLRSSRPKGKR
jgi:DNA-binding MarR family transcriptional regulator